MKKIKKHLSINQTGQPNPEQYYKQTKCKKQSYEKIEDEEDATSIQDPTEKTEDNDCCGCKKACKCCCLCGILCIFLPLKICFECF